MTHYLRSIRNIKSKKNSVTPYRLAQSINIGKMTGRPSMFKDGRNLADYSPNYDFGRKRSTSGCKEREDNTSGTFRRQDDLEEKRIDRRAGSRPIA